MEFEKYRQELDPLVQFKDVKKLFGGIAKSTFYDHADKGHYDAFLFQPTPDKYFIKRDAFLDWLQKGGYQGKGGERGKGKAAV